MKFLFHPKVTLAATITAIGSIAAVCASIVIAIAPLPAVPGLSVLGPYVQRADLVLGAVAAVATAVAGIGRSFAPLIDAGAPPAPSPKGE
jgi:hypothetical protein